MEWAKNHLGEIVAASEFGVLRWGLTCPNCGEPVIRRAGAERRPHFAHYSNRAKPDCESYFPSQGTGGSAVAGGMRGQRVVERLRSIQSGLFLFKDSERRSVELLLRVPDVATTSGDGALEIVTSIGSRTYTTTQLTRARLVPVPPTSPPASCFGSGVLVSLAIYLNELVAEFGNWLNLFHCGENGGRLLARSERLEWGQKYLVISPDKLDVPQAAAGALALDALGHLSTWFVYEVTLAELGASHSRELLNAVAHFFGREIGVKRPKAYLLYPLPHHIDLDGTIVVEHWPNTLVIRVTSDSPLALVSGGESSAIYTTRRTSDGFVCLDGLSVTSNEVVLTIAGRDQFVIRREDSGLFAPQGVVVAASGESWNIAICRPFDRNLDKGSMVSIECPSVRLAAHLGRRNSGWKLAGTTLVANGALCEFFGGNFGEVRFDRCFDEFNSDEPTEDGHSSVHADIRPSRWLSWSLQRQLRPEESVRFNLYAHRSGIPSHTLLRAQVGSNLLPYLKSKSKNND